MNISEDFKTVVELIEDLTNTASTNEKLAKLKDIKDLNNNDTLLFKKVLNYAYNPRFVFGLKPKVKSDEKFTNEDIENGIVYNNVFELLDDLLSREITGDKARLAYLKFVSTNEENVVDILNRILDKNIKAGINDKSINKVFDKLIPTTPYMRCSLLSEITDVDAWVNPTKGYLIAQKKMDGMFININVNEDGVVLTTRQGNELLTENNQLLTNLIGELSKLEMLNQYHGELLIYDKKNKKYVERQIANGWINSILKKPLESNIDEDAYSIVVRVWDKVSYKFLSTYSNDDGFIYEERLSSIENDLKKTDRNLNLVDVVEYKKVKNIYDVKDYLVETLKNMEEGLVVKLPEMLWSDSTSRGQMKLKNKFVVELKPKKYLDGTGKNVDYFGSIECWSSDEKLCVNVSVSGFTDKEKDEIMLDKDGFLNNILSVSANSIMYSTNENTPHSLFLPVFVETRLDKDVADDMERIVYQFDNSFNIEDEFLKLIKLKEEKDKAKAEKKQKKMKISK